MSKNNFLRLSFLIFFVINIIIFRDYCNGSTRSVLIAGKIISEIVLTVSFQFIVFNYLFDLCVVGQSYWISIVILILWIVNIFFIVMEILQLHPLPWFLIILHSSFAVSWSFLDDSESDLWKTLITFFYKILWMNDCNSANKIYY